MFCEKLINPLLCFIVMPKNSVVSVLKTSPKTVLKDYKNLMYLADYQKFLPKNKETVLKLNLSWSKYFPSCSTQPWQLEGVLKTMLDDGYKNIHPVENRTVVTDVWKGAEGNKWLPILEKYEQKYEPLTETEWVEYKAKKPLLALYKIFPEGHKIPKLFIGKNVVHFPTIKCVHPDTEIFQDDGSLIKISDFVEQVHESGEVVCQDGDLVSVLRKGVFSLTEEGIKKSDVTYFWKTKNTSSLIYVRLKTGRTVKTSQTHPFLTQRGWVIASELTKEDRIAIPRMIDIQGESQSIPNFLKDFETPDINKIDFKKGKKHSAELQKYVVSQYISGKKLTELSKELNINFETLRNFLIKYQIPIRWVRIIPKIPNKTSPEFWEWIGLLLSEGYIFYCNGSLRTSWSNVDDSLAKRYCDLTNQLFVIDVKCRKTKSSSATEYYFDCNLIKPLYDFLGITLPTSSENKIIPDMLFKCTKEEIGAFFAGYIDGDGSVGKDGMHIVSKSSKLIQRMQLLLTRLGVVSFINETRNRATNSNMDFETYYKISIYSDDLINFSKYLKLISKNKVINLNDLIIKRKNSKLPSNWDTIPVDQEIFRYVRGGLGLTQESSGKASGVNSIENYYSLPTRSVMSYFVDLFKKLDKDKDFAKEIKYMEFISSNDIAWDHIVMIKQVDSDTPYLYDLTVPEHHSFIGNGIILHNTHGHTTMTGAMKNAFGGLITEHRHHCHKMIHEVLVDLLQIQKEIHPGIFAVMDGTVCGDGAGPRTMIPVIKNYVLASQDQVAIDAVSASMMGYDPFKIDFLRMAHDKGLGCCDIKQIDVVGEDISGVNFHFKTNKSLIIAGDQLFRKGMFSFVEPLLFHTPLFKMCIFASEFYHDYLWYNTVGKYRISKFMKTEWGKLWQSY